MSTHALFCAPTDTNPATSVEHYCEAADVPAGDGWSVGMSHTRGEGAVLQLLNDEVIRDPIDGMLSLGAGLRLAFAIVRQVARAQVGRILRKWTRQTRHDDATPLSHSGPLHLGSR